MRGSLWGLFPVSCLRQPAACTGRQGTDRRALSRGLSLRAEPQDEASGLGRRLCAPLVMQQDPHAKSLLRDEEGTTSVEWIVVCGIVVLILAVALTSVVNTLKSRIEDFNDEL